MRRIERANRDIFREANARVLGHLSGFETRSILPVLEVHPNGTHLSPTGDESDPGVGTGTCSCQTVWNGGATGHRGMGMEHRGKRRKKRGKEGRRFGEADPPAP
ncbi:hypothetical protein KM043_008628 [Ampulex compressa]|nr:hypothetical protein KM043_008628 [Ampulex compressa]